MCWGGREDGERVELVDGWREMRLVCRCKDIYRHLWDGRTLDGDVVVRGADAPGGDHHVEAVHLFKMK